MIKVLVALFHGGELGHHFEVLEIRLAPLLESSPLLSKVGLVLRCAAERGEDAVYKGAQLLNHLRACVDVEWMDVVLGARRRRLAALERSGSEL